jgi:sugar lactone lactonase YvrE
MQPAPDGLAVDEDDGVWVAVLGAGEVRRFRYDGTVDDIVVRAPSRWVTSVAIGGSDATEMYLTLAAEPEDSGDESGGVVRIRSPYGGVVQPLARI